MNRKLAFRLALAEESKESPIVLDEELYAYILDYFQSFGLDTSRAGPGYGPYLTWKGVPVILG